jgi:tetratricopeptide (TPR) repeat protein
MRALIYFIGFVLLLVAPCFADKKLDNLIAKKDFEKAIKYIETEFKDSKDEEVLYYLGYANEKLGFNEKAIASYLTIQRTQPNNRLVLSGLARTYCTMGLCERSYLYSSKCVEIDSTAEEHRILHAAICYKIGKLEEAKKSFEYVKHSNEAQNVLGSIYFESKQYKQAIPYLLQQYNAQKTDSIAMKLSICYSATNDTDSALVYLKQVKNISTDDRLKLARLYSKKAKCEQAFSEYSKLNVQSFEYEDFINQGQCSEKQNDKVRAIAFYESALKKNSNNFVKLRIATIYIDIKNFSSASKYVKELETQNVGDEFDKLAVQYYDKTNNYERVSHYASKILKNDSTNVSMYFVLINAFEKQGMTTRVKQMTEKLANLKDTPESSRQLADYYFENKNYSKALNFYEKSYIATENVQLLEKIAISAYRLKDYDKSKDASETLFRKGANSLECRKILYEIAFNKQKYSIASQHLEILVQSEPKLIFFKDLAACFKNMNKQDKLLNIDAKIIELDKKNIESRERLASSCVSKGSFGQALWLYYELENLRNFSIADYFNVVSLLEKTNDDTNQILYLKKIVSIEPTNSDAHKKLGDVYFKQKKYDDAYLEYNKTMSLAYSRTDFLKNFSYVVIEKKNQAEIIRICERTFLQNLADSYVLLNLAETYYKMFEFSKALNVFKKIPQEKISVPTLLKIAVCQEKTNDISGAILSYEQYITLSQTAKQEYLDLARLYSKTDKKEQEIATYKAYLKKYDDEKLNVTVAKFEYEKNNFNEAIKYFSKPNVFRDPELTYMFGRSMYMIKQYDDAISVLSTCEKYSGFSKLSDVYKLVAISHENLKNIEKAIKYYKLYTQIEQRDSSICYHIGELQEQLHVNLAKDVYETNTKKFLNDSRNFYRLAEIFYKQNDYKRAKQAFEKTKNLNDTVSVEFLGKLAKCYRETNERDNEIKSYKELLLKDNKNFAANKYLGIYCYEAGEIREGLAYLELAKAQNFNDPDMLYILGRIYLKDGFSNDAFMFLQSAKKQRPNDQKIRMFIIESYKKFSKQREAIVEIEELLKVDRSYKNLDLYAKTLFEIRNYQGAETVALEMRKKEPRDIELMMFLAQIKIEQVLFDDALEYCKMISYVDSRHAASICKRADIYVLKKDAETAKEFYLKAIKVDPKYAMSYYGLGMIYKFSGDNKQYVENISKAVALDSTNSVISEELKRAKQ